MRFLVDENLPASLAGAARRRGHEARWVYEAMGGAPDAEILDALRTSAETPVTRDVRFANLVRFATTADARLEGAVLVREQQMTAVEAAWSQYLDRGVAPRRTVAVVDARGVRIRNVA